MDIYEAPSNVSIRAYRSADAETTLRIFQEAIMVTAAGDYTRDQLNAWARPDQLDVTEWDQSMLRRNSVVASLGGQVGGFSDVSKNGYIDMLYVSPDFARRGVPRALMAFLEKQARSNSAQQLTANVSITARPFFEAVGFHVQAEQHPVVNGVVITNFHMTKDLVSRA
ncbi:GNAT family N-acetyltransferase [Enteractinococcus fodinae]|uniref:Acetyltransferase n=1 Tax=Enteractinococcus fodinae TaxID=684663 RepID=A0ABU2AZ17_9MICC|nr:GNAT family N-acetyltransferase [Enteractinococcus fodinae]MDR7346581.1 putative acetyltransferase [Enteractinococcus fodinae]